MQKVRMIAELFRLQKHLTSHRRDRKTVRITRAVDVSFWCHLQNKNKTRRVRKSARTHCSCVLQNCEYRLRSEVAVDKTCTRVLRIFELWNFVFIFEVGIRKLPSLKGFLFC